MQQMAKSQGLSTPGVLDVSGLDAPDNILAVLKKASDLPPGASLEIIIRSNPFQLYDLLQQRGYFLEMKPQADGSFRGVLRQRDKTALMH